MRQQLGIHLQTKYAIICSVYITSNDTPFLCIVLNLTEIGYNQIYKRASIFAFVHIIVDSLMCGHNLQWNKIFAQA
jgi:hypothetical protein